MNQHLEAVWQQVRSLPDDRQRELAQVLVAFLDHSLDLYLCPEQLDEVERYVTNQESYATDEEVRAVFARLTKMRLRWTARALVELRAMYAYMSNDDLAAAKRLVNWTEEATRRLLVVPMSGGMTEGIRALAVLGAPYVVAYRVRDEIVDILGIVYTDRRLCS